jgi:hypothetical protein
VLRAAERVVRTTAEIYANPSMRLKDLMVDRKIGSETGDDVVAAFSRACRDELDVLKRQL